MARLTARDYKTARGRPLNLSRLREFGVRYAIVGHSERRQYHGETDEVVADKAKAALAHGVTPIVLTGL